MSVSIIAAKESDRKKVAWSIVKDAIVNSEELPFDRRGYEMMSSSARNLLVRYPENKKERRDLIAKINEFIRMPEIRVMDFNILSYVSFRLSNGYDASDFFQNRANRNTEKIMMYARTTFKFKDNKEKDEELY